MNTDRQSIRIIYMGTPGFAVSSLRALVENDFNVVAVVTMPDKPAGRGHQLQYSAVKQYALSANLPVLQPERLKDPDFITQLQDYHADLQIVVAFRMLPEVVWAMPRLGTFNLHASLLPQYRGAAPINWAVINGEKQTGVTTFMLQQQIDTGDMIMQQAIDIADDEEVNSVHDRLMTIGAQMVVRTTELIIQCDRTSTPLPVIPQPQIPDIKPAPKIFKGTCRISFSQTAEQIRNHVRGLCPYPAAWIGEPLPGHPLAHLLQGAKVFRVAKTEHNRQPGHIILPCADGFIDILELQLPGKKRMSATALLNGLRQ